MKKSQRHLAGFVVCYIVAMFVYWGIRSNRRRIQEERLRKLEQIKVAMAKRRTKSVVFARENIRGRTEIKKRWLEVKEVEERDLPKQPYCRSLDEAVGAYSLVDIYHGEPVIEYRISRTADSNRWKLPDCLIGHGTYLEDEKARLRAIVIKVFPYDVNGARLLPFKHYDVCSLYNGKRAPLVEAVRVIWAGNKSKESKECFVTLEADLANCEKLLLTNIKGSLTFKRVRKQ